MECNRDEAARAKALAERKMLDKDFVGAKKIIIKVQQLLKEVEDVDIPKMLTVCDVHCAAGAKVNNEIDWYGILQVPVHADEALIKKQYRKLAILLHPDKNKFGGAEAAFKLVGEANITLTDRSKRSVHDMKRNAFRSIIPRSNHQPPKRPAPARSSSIPVNLHNMHQQHQHQASNPTMPQTTFWTICPACGMRYQYYLEILKKSLRCQKCLKPFIAHDLKNQAIPSGANQRSAGVWKTAGAPQNSAGPQTIVEGDNMVEDDFVDSPALKRLRKSGLLHGDHDHSTKTAKLNEDTAGHNGLSSCSSIKGTKNGGTPCEEKTPNGVEQMKRQTMHSLNSAGKGLFHFVSNNGLGLNNDDASDDNKFTFQDAEFFDFDKLRDASQFRANQIWAVYDDQGCMPRFYARITRVKMIPKLMLHFVWLEFNPANKAEKAWSYRGLPVACGHFKHGQSETANETGMFSRTISFEKSKTNNFYEIYPRKGEVWALFKGWDIGWSSDAGNHKKLNHRYEVVQVLSDFITSTSIIAMPLVKIKGYVSLFMQSGEAAPYVIPQGETLRFSHCVPHHLMSGTEKEGIPEGSLELDPAALPFNMEDAFPSPNPVGSQDCDSKHAGLSSGDHKGSMNVGQGQHTKSVNAGIPTKTPKEEMIKHNTHVPEVTDVNDDDDNICQTEYVCAESEFYDFSEIRLLQRFSPGQIWALYSDIDKFPNYYALIQKVDPKNGKVQVRWLDVCPQGEVEKRLSQEERTISIGTFRLSNVLEMTTYTDTDAFSHPVASRYSGRKGEYEIFPRLGEIWAVYKNWRAGWTAQDFKKCEYELVEIFGHTDSSIQVRLVRKVDGYKTVFMSYRAAGSVKTIRMDEYPKFSHQIPCFHLTHEKGGKLRGYLELDPLSVPQEFLY